MSAVVSSSNSTSRVYFRHFTSIVLRIYSFTLFPPFPCLLSHSEKKKTMELEIDDDNSAMSSPPSFKTKLKHSLLFSCCFRRRRRQVLDSPPPPSTVTASSDDKPTVIWLKKKVASHDFKDEIKDKCITVFSRIGNASSGKHKRHSSAEFRYDPLSYSLNFEDGFDCDDEAPLRNFSSRLPPSPPPHVKIMPPIREIAAVS